MPKVTGLHFLIESLGEKRYYEITEEVTRIGRDVTNHVQLANDPEVSRKHARLVIENSGEGELRYWLEDHSLNGIFVNGEQVKERLEIHLNDKITLSGDSSLVMRDATFERQKLSTPSPIRGITIKNKRILQELQAGSQPVSPTAAPPEPAIPTRGLDPARIRAEHLENFQRMLEQDDAPYFFISHVTDDDAIATEFYQRLQALGITPWMDHEDLRLTRNWENEIQNALRQSWGGLQIITRKSLASPACQGERQYFDHARKPMYIVLLEKINLDDLPFTVISRQFLDMTTNYEQRLTKLLREIAYGAPARSEVKRTDDPTQPTKTLLKGKVYLCHSYDPADGATLAKVRATLKDSGLEVWRDMDGNTPGYLPHSHAARDAIRKADCVLALLTPAADRSRVMASELEYAKNQHKPIFVIKVKNATSPLILSLTPVLETNIERNYDSQMDRLLAKLREHLETK